MLISATDLDLQLPSRRLSSLLSFCARGQQFHQMHFWRRLCGFCWAYVSGAGAWMGEYGAGVNRCSVRACAVFVLFLWG